MSDAPAVLAEQDYRHRIISEMDPELLIAEGMENAIIGIATLPGGIDVVAYDIDKCIAALIYEQGMDDQEASDWMDYNVLGASVGPRTPIFIRPL